MQITIGNREFKTKKVLLEYIRALRDRYPDFKQLSAADFAFMLALLQNHESAEIKIGCGVVSMDIRRDPYGGRCFWLRRADNTETDFSFHLCLKSQSKLHEFKQACRRVVSQAVIDFKREFFANSQNIRRCPYTGEILQPGPETHVDHAPPNTFDVIFKAFITERGIDIEAVEFIESTDGHIGSELVDKQLARDFLNFHNARARLRVISKTANLALAQGAQL